MTLTLLILIPLIGLLAILVLPKKHENLIKQIALGATVLQMVWFLAQVLPVAMQGGTGEFIIEEEARWLSLSLGSLGSLNIHYHLGIDGLSLVLLLLSVMIFPIATLASFSIKRRIKTYFALILLLNLSIIGCFMALDFFLFYLLYEFMLLPMFFLIGVWGGERREYAAIKFFIYTLFGSVFMLLIMLGLSFSFIDPAESAVLAGLVDSAENATPEIIAQIQQQLAACQLPGEFQAHTFDITLMSETVNGGLANIVPGSIFDYGSTLLGFNARILAFLVLFLGFAIKIPVVPLHTWLPDAHVEAPTPVSVLLAAILLKVGGYGILRICYSIFPEGGLVFADWIAFFGVLSILYGALLAMHQKDLKALIAYSSISHMGFVLLGIASMEPSGINGAVFQMFNHGIVSAALFLVVGVIYDRTHDRTIANYSGLWTKMPRYTVAVLIAFFASMGLPGLNSFVSEMVVLFGSVNSAGLSHWFSILAVLGILFAAVYYLRTFRQMFFGSFGYYGSEGHGRALSDLTSRESLLLFPLCLAMIVLGLVPSLVLDLMDVSISDFTVRIGELSQSFIDLRGSTIPCP